jgi:hypothetical protein
MDRALWAIWFDLKPEHVDDYLKWSHDEYLPALRARPGVVWTAQYKNATGPAMLHSVHQRFERPAQGEAGTGTQFVQLVGATDPMVLFGPSVLDEEANATGRKREMLDLRVSPQSYLFNETYRVNGPELHLRTPGSTPGPAIQMGMLRIRNAEAEHAVGKWYVNSRLPLIARMAGAISARVYSCLCGWPEIAVLYEFESIEARAASFEPQETALAKGPPAGEVHTLPMGELIHCHGSPMPARRIWPPVQAAG